MGSCELWMRPVDPASLSLLHNSAFSSLLTEKIELFSIPALPGISSVRSRCPADRDVDKLDSDRRKDEEGDGDLERPLHDDLVGELRGFPRKTWGRPSPPETSHSGHSNC